MNDRQTFDCLEFIVRSIRSIHYREFPLSFRVRAIAFTAAFLLLRPVLCQKLSCVLAVASATGVVIE